MILFIIFRYLVWLKGCKKRWFIFFREIEFFSRYKMVLFVVFRDLVWIRDYKRRVLLYFKVYYIKKNVINREYWMRLFVFFRELIIFIKCKVRVFVVFKDYILVFLMEYKVIFLGE